MVKVKQFTFNPFSENTFILWDDETNEAAAIDPGMSTINEQNTFTDYIEKHNLNIKYLINTHCHIDHILGCKYVKEKFYPVYYAPEKDLILLDNASKQAEMFDIVLENPPKPDKLILDDSEIYLGQSKIKFLFTAGHTPGEYCLYIEKEKICVTGDVLFKEGIGRTDLWGGDYKTLMNSIEKKLLSLPDDVIIFPGHGESSTIGHEKQYNPFLV